MITANDMMAKMGKEKFIEYVGRGRGSQGSGERQFDVERRKSRGRIKHRQCQHGVWVLENYEPKRCGKCIPETRTKGKDFEPHFNLGLGCFVETRSEMNRIAKENKMIPIGNERLR